MYKLSCILMCPQHKNFLISRRDAEIVCLSAYNQLFVLKYITVNVRHLCEYHYTVFDFLRALSLRASRSF
jgi:hypothetical protein